MFFVCQFRYHSSRYITLTEPCLFLPFHPYPPPLLLLSLRPVSLKVPPSAMEVYQRAEVFRRHTGNLDLIVNMYNDVQVRYNLPDNYFLSSFFTSLFLLFFFLFSFSLDRFELLFAFSIFFLIIKCSYFYFFSDSLPAVEGAMVATLFNFILTNAP